MMCSLTERYDVQKDIGDGSFGSVVLAKVKRNGSGVARQGSVVAIKTMKKTFDTFQGCLELREVIFLKNLPAHPHLVPALDIFLDPMTKKLHIAMEYMDGNLYQLMKSRDHKCLDGASVKSILFQILSGLEHIHANGFFHRDIKPENILVATPQGPTADANAPFQKYDSRSGRGSSPVPYTVKIADFGLARETSSKVPYTTYVSTRWYRAPEVLLRAGEYSAPVDIWAVGAMAVEIATLKPLFPGSNEVDQVWRVCEVMGSPGNWQSRSGRKLGGGEWKDGARLAQKLGFSFPRMSPQSIEQYFLPTAQWPASLSQFITSCLLWDPKLRPTSIQSLQHEYFADAVDPTKPRHTASTSARILRNRQSEIARPSQTDMASVYQQQQPVAVQQASSPLQSKPSWFRKSFVGGSGLTSSSSSNNLNGEMKSTKVAPPPAAQPYTRPPAEKRSTWHGSNNTAPAHILPTIKPLSPLGNTVTVQAGVRNASPYLENSPQADRRKTVYDEKGLKKIGRQLSTNSQQQYTNPAHAAALSSLTGQQQQTDGNSTRHSLVSPMGSSSSSSLFSHFRKRVRRLSGRNQLPVSPPDDLEAQAGCGPWISNRSSMIIDSNMSPIDTGNAEYRAPNRESYGNNTSDLPNGLGYQKDNRGQLISPPPSGTTGIRRNPSVPPQGPRADPSLALGAPVSSRTRRAIAKTTAARYETPDEEEELLDEALVSTARVVRRLESSEAITPRLTPDEHQGQYSYPTPPSNKHNSLGMGIFGQAISKGRRRAGNRDEEVHPPRWATPPTEDTNWAATAAASAYTTAGRR